MVYIRGKCMKIAIAGVGYVGLSNAMLLAQNNQVIAYDIIPEKIDKLNKKVKGSLSVKNSRKDINYKTGSYIIKGNFINKNYK